MNDTLIDKLVHHVRTSEHLQAKATDDSDFYVGAISAFSRAAADAEPFEKRRIVAEGRCKVMQEALGVMADSFEQDEWPQYWGIARQIRKLLADVEAIDATASVPAPAPPATP